MVCHIEVPWLVPIDAEGTGWYLAGNFMGLWHIIPPFGARCLQREEEGKVELERGRGKFLLDIPPTLVSE